MATMRLPPPPDSHVVLLIDSDDLCPEDVDALISDLTTHGPRVMVRRIYGRWTLENMCRWRRCLARHALQPIGYGRLFSRIREQGAVVYGYGSGGAQAEDFAAACDRYRSFAELDGHPDKQVIHATPSTPTSTPVTNAQAAAVPMPAHAHVALSQPIQIDQTARDALTLGIFKSAQPDGQALLDDVAEYMWKSHGCCHCMYGYDDSLQFVRATGIAYSKRLITNGHLPPITFVSLKTGAGATMSGSEGLVYRMEEMVVVPTELGHARAHDVATQQECLADYEVITTI
ncbi:hypothetical protein LTR22_000214 [Elasticomyces elasticus]|nr:hypothetical protein LTR22_000214 [Elasticomyces elasticus]